MKKPYRPDIDALRGYAVLFVILYHANLVISEKFYFSGGFIGVDIFFVITGFLITKILLKEYELNKSINIINFYERRFRRLIPTLTIILLAGTLLAYFVLEPTKLKHFSESVFASLIFVANMYFHYFGNTYGTDSALMKPLLHLWSLGVEEQLYIIFPIGFFFILKYFRKYLVYFLILGFIVSLLFASLIAIRHEMFNFYMLPSRAWEIIAGSLAALFLSKKKISLNYMTINILTSLSLITLILCLFLFSTDLKHPSYITLIPILSATCLIIIGEKENFSVLNKLVYNKFFIFLGKISYSLYLWHFLLFSLFRNSVFDETILSKLFLIILSTLLSYITYIYIERKYRDKKIDFKKTMQFVILLLIPILVINIFYLSNNVIIKKNYSVDNINLTEWNDTSWMIRNLKKINKKKFLDGKKNVLIVGNCHGDDIFYSLATDETRYKNFNFIMHPRIEISNFININSNNSDLYKDADVIILATKWRANDLIKLDEIIKKLKNDNKEIIIIGPNPEFNYELKKYKFTKIYFTNYKKKILEKGKTNLSNDEITELQKKYYYQYNENKEIINTSNKLNLISKNNNVKFIDLISLVCDHETYLCNFRSEKNKDELFRDYGRFSVSGLAYFAKKFSEIKLLNY